MTADIVPFPKPIPSPEPQQGSRHRQRDQIMSHCGEPLLPEEKAAGDAKAAIRTGSPSSWTAEDHANYVASVVRIAIRSAKRRGVRLESMLSIPRKWLLDLCDEGDPTCIVVRDWLMGNRKHLPKDLEDAANAWTSGKWGDA
ncbi:hypothetical protein ACK6D9_02935 [Hoeflea sp. Naph1]|uniref:hypothetical protein n=1 Tax=Hoeflea sp. Naph1 TaxID=3388653 RepID=UPI00398FEC27